MKRTIHLGILGAGGIARVFASTVRGMNEKDLGDVELTVVAARDLSRAEEFARKESVQRAYGSYEEMASDPEVDLIYIATPHSHHYEHAKLCIEHGKHVLCEKAFTVNARQAQDICRRAKEAGVLITEAIWTRYQPMRKLIRDTLESGIVGKPSTLTANLSYSIAMNDRIVNPALAGGALLDVGVYTLNFAEMVFGRAKKVSASCVLTDRGVDRSDSMTLFWEDGRMAVLTAGTTSVSDRYGIIYCENGFIQVENINNPQKLEVYGSGRSKPELMKEISCPEQITGYEYEIMEAADAVRIGALECESMPHDETIHIMELMDHIRAQMGIHYEFE